MGADRVAAPHWRDHLNDDEAAEVAVIDARVKLLTAERERLVDKRRRIMNRCSKRKAAAT